MIPLLVIVGADKGGVGKTTISRALLDYIREHNKVFRAFDTEYPVGTLVRFFPDEAVVVDITKSDDQMKIFDNMSRSQITVIDVRAGLLSPTLQTLSDIGFLDMAKDGKIRIVVFHVIGSTIASINEVKTTAAMMEPAQHFVVKNHVNGAKFFDGIDSVAKDMFNNTTVLEIPQLDARATEYVEASNLPFNSFANDENQSMVLRGKVKHWIRQVFGQFDKVKLEQ